MICLREKLNDTDLSSPFLILLSCAWCKKMEEIDHNLEDIEKINKIHRLLIEPVFIMFNNADDFLFRGIGILFLEKTQKNFPKDKNCEKNIAKLNNIFKSSYGNLHKKLFDFFSTVEEYTYLEILKRTIYEKIAPILIMNFINANIKCAQSSFRTRLYFRNEKDNFFDIGVSLDEGIVQYMTLQICEDKIPIKPNDESTYYFEVKYIERLISMYGEHRVIRATFPEEYFKDTKEERPIDFIYNITAISQNKCDFYDLYRYTDNQDWKSAISLLKRIKGEN